MKQFSFIFVGDTHGAADDFKKQKEAIETFEPEFVLAESLQDIRLENNRQFSEIQKRRFISDTVSFNDARRLINLCKKKKIKLIGIDLHNFGLDKQLRYAMASTPTAAQERVIHSIVEKRQRLHVRRIREYARKTNRPIVVILGAWHLQEGSPLMVKLENYKVIFPCDGKGNMLIGPGTKKICYCEREK